MLDEAELRLMSPEQRARLARTLACLDAPRLLNDPKAKRRRKLALTLAIGSCVFLAAWIGVLAVTLPDRYSSGGWRGAWVGFDVALLLAFASVAWTAWRGKQLLIVCLIVTATLLCCDAWFDLTLDWGTSGIWFSLLSAIVAELPLAILLALGARRLLRLTVATEMALDGRPGPGPPLGPVALRGPGLGGRADARPDCGPGPNRTDSVPAESGRVESGGVQPDGVHPGGVSQRSRAAAAGDREPAA
jgi:hypothetical protein